MSLKRFKKWRWIAALAVLSLIGLHCWHNRQSAREERFVAHWARLFQTCPTAESLQRLDPSERPDLILIRRFSNGQWVAVRNEYSCMDGAGFDASVWYDSTRKIRFDTSRNFCGYEGLCGELGFEASNLEQFYDGAAALGVHLREWKE